MAYKKWAEISKFLVGLYSKKNKFCEIKPKQKKKEKHHLCVRLLGSKKTKTKCGALMCYLLIGI